MSNVIATSVRVYSRTMLDDTGAMSRYEYAGSFSYAGDLETMPDAEKEGYAKAFDTFYDVLFIKDGCYGIAYTMADYR